MKPETTAPNPGSDATARAKTPASAPAGIASAPSRTSEPNAALRRLVFVAGALVLAVGLVMLANQWVRPAEEPWRSKSLDGLRKRLLDEPKNEELKKAIRDQDRQLRLAYFRALERNRSGTFLLVASGAGLILLARRGLGSPHVTSPRAAFAVLARDAAAARARWTVVAAGSACAVTFLALGWTDRTRLPELLVRNGTAATAPKGTHAASATTPPAPSSASIPTAAAATGPTPEQWARNWPQFRGPTGAGLAASTTLPTSWDVATGRGIVWRTNLALVGYNSPVVWDKRVFLTGGDKKARLVFCHDAATGALRWQRPVTPTNAPAAAIEPPEQSGPAASTVATDGERVFAIFASGELGSLDFEGNLVWSKRLDFADNGYGHASSLVVHDGKLLVQADQGQADDGKSILHALDARTGAPVWTAKRPVGGSWATPLVIEAAGKKQVITSGDPWLMGHDLATGAELWRAKVLGGELAPSPVFAHGLVVAVSPGRAFVAVKPDATGDVTASQVAWRLEKEVPDVPSPTIAGDLLFSANTEGLLICRDLKSGEKIWEHAFEMEFQASPLVAGDRLYLFAQAGDVFVVGAGREYREIAAFKMGDEIAASPAVAGDRMYVRTKKTLYCLGAAAGPSQVADVR